MLIVGTDAARVEADLVAGRLSCPACGDSLRPWGHGADREVRLLGGVERRRFRRSVCPACRVTHVLLPEDTLVRRRDGAEVVGAALTAKVKGEGHRRVALGLGRPASTVRGWLRRFAAMADRLRQHFTRWAHAVEPTFEHRFAGQDAFGDAVEAIGVLGIVTVRRFGPRPVWSLASVVTGGGLLANTSSPWATPV